MPLPNVHASVRFDASSGLIMLILVMEMAFIVIMQSRLPLMEAAMWKEEFTYMKFGRSYTLRLPRRW